MRQKGGLVIIHQPHIVLIHQLPVGALQLLILCVCVCVCVGACMSVCVCVRGGGEEAQSNFLPTFTCLLPFFLDLTSPHPLFLPYSLSSSQTCSSSLPIPSHPPHSPLLPTPSLPTSSTHLEFDSIVLCLKVATLFLVCLQPMYLFLQAVLGLLQFLILSYEGQVRE